MYSDQTTISRNLFAKVRDLFLKALDVITCLFIISLFVLSYGCAGKSTRNSQPPLTTKRATPADIGNKNQNKWKNKFTPPQATFSEIEKAVTPYGKWIEVPVYGKVWKPDPAIVGKNWIPYTRGRWIYTNWGWTWISEFKDWGWAAFHFGRFAYTPTAGWVMITDIIWSPAQVTWRESENSIGWAPVLPGYSVSEAIRFGSSINTPRKGWVFVKKEDFTSPSITQHLIPGQELINIFRTSSTLSQWKKYGRQYSYIGPNRQSLIFENNLEIPIYSFYQANSEFSSRLFPNGFDNTTLKKDISQYSEVRLDVDRRVAVVGPNSPKKIPNRRFKKVYQSSSSPITPTSKQLPKSTRTPTRRTIPVRRTTSTNR